MMMIIPRVATTKSSGSIKRLKVFSQIHNILFLYLHVQMKESIIWVIRDTIMVFSLYSMMEILIQRIGLMQMALILLTGIMLRNQQDFTLKIQQVYRFSHTFTTDASVSTTRVGIAPPYGVAMNGAYFYGFQLEEGASMSPVFTYTYNNTVSATTVTFTVDPRIDSLRLELALPIKLPLH